MASRKIHRLPASYQRLKLGLHSDGNCLYLQVSKGPAGNRRRSWILRYALKGQYVVDENGDKRRQKYRDMGLGSVNEFTLDEARERAREYRKLIKDGIDPIEHHRAEVAQNLAAKAAVMTFDQAAAAYIRGHKAEWTASHAAQWESSLRAYVSPIIGRMSVAGIETSHVVKAIEPIWLEKPVTADRVRGRIELVLGWATVSGLRKGDNPARWRGHLDNLLSARNKIRATKHQLALPYSEMPAFMPKLRERRGMAALALEFAILTCVRTADVRNAKWKNVDRAEAMWTIPAFSKTAAQHRVPLSAAALAAFDKAHAMAKQIAGKVGASPLMFPNDVTGAPLSENAMLGVLKRMNLKGVATVHGFRSTFRTWALEQSNFPWELAELSLGHTVGSEVERAYQRGDAFVKRRAIMESWARVCARPPATATVTPIRRKAKGA
jgi:integrase